MRRALGAATTLSATLAALLLLALEARAESAASPTSSWVSPRAPFETHSFIRVSAGGSARGLYDSYVVGGDAKVGVGIETSAGAYSLGVSFFAGTTEGGFLTLHATAGIDMTWRVGIVRLGLEPRVGYIGLARETTDRQFGAYTFGLAAHGSVDLWSKGATTLALGLEPMGDVAVALGSDGSGDDVPAPLYGGRAFFEVRYDLE